MWKANILLGLATATIGIYVFTDSFRHPYAVNFGPGPGFSQYWLGLLLTVVSIAFVVVNLLRRETGPGFPFTGETMLRSCGLFLLLGGAILMIERAGFVTAMALFMVVVLRVFEKRSWRFSVIVGLATPLAVFLLFALVFNVPLPRSLPVLV